MRILKRFCLAASYVTAFPFLKKAQTESDLFGLAKYLPAVGTAIGGMLILCAFLLKEFQAPQILFAVLLVLLWISMTGAIHLDGFMDTADGIFSHRSRDRMLEIMRDSRVGNYAVISGNLLILTKIAALVSLPIHWLIPSLLLIPAWSRWNEVLTIVSYRYARDEGMGRIWKLSTKKSDLLTAAIIPLLSTAIYCFYASSWKFALLPLLIVASGAAFSYCINKIINGQTGDSYGATVEFSEAAGLSAAAFLSANLS